LRNKSFKLVGGEEGTVNRLDDFRRVLLEAVDEALLALGDSVRKAIYWHLENRFSIKRDEILDKLGEFNKALEDMLGAGADILLKIMVKRLYVKLNISFEEKPEWNFKDYVEYAKKSVII